MTEIGLEAEQLSLSHQKSAEAWLSPLRRKLGSECLSDFCFSNLYLFRRAHHFCYLPGTYPCIAGMTYDGTRHILPLFDLSAVPVSRLRDLLENADCFFPVASDVVQRLDPNIFRCTAFQDDADYLYRAENFRTYRGSGLRKKRSQMEKMLAEYAIETHPLGPDTIPDAEEVLDQWTRDKGKAEGEADALAVRDALTRLQDFALRGTVYRTRHRPVGFLIAQALAPGVDAIRFAKGIHACHGIYPYMFHHYCVTHAVDWLNFEQDLGIPGFRQSKRSYQPERLLAKYRVSLVD